MTPVRRCQNPRRVFAARAFLFTTALALVATLSACDMTRQAAPAPVYHFGMKVDSPTGAVLVRKGDTVWSISQRYRLPLRDVIDANNLSPPYPLAAGQRLRLPPPREHRVAARETLYGVARLYGVSVADMVRLNKIPKPYHVREGQVLRLPSRLPPSSSPTSATAASSVVKRQAVPQPRTSSAPKTSAALRPALQGAVKPSAAPPRTTLAAPSRQGFVWPVRGKVLSTYGPKAGNLHNDGINIAAPRGTPVAAAADGVVAYTGNDLASYGNLVLVRHADGLVTAYAHLNSIAVSRGATLRRGDPIGTVGSTGSVANPQLHFEIRRGVVTYDPMKYL